ncbi:protein brambleberry isoform X4 [Hypanus sabinus]|uniref:protein brambleberry isoform X4 n=1 Tax=Hypanus sabinus TaxID=79690 RepID=UPI0028C4CD7B|nr:protein brambleberry isoform X4 [Hypanus sabinus]
MTRRVCVWRWSTLKEERESISDISRMHKGNGPRHMECLPHCQQPGLLSVLHGPAAGVQEEDRDDSELFSGLSFQSVGSHDTSEGWTKRAVRADCLFVTEDSSLLQQEQLQGGQQDLESSINGNLERLTEEKELIASGHQQVTKLIDGITLTMESNLVHFAAQQSQTANHYDQLMDKLQTVTVVVHVLAQLEKGVNQRLNSFLQWTDTQPRAFVPGKCSFSRLGEELDKLDQGGLQGEYALENGDFIRSSALITAPGEAMLWPTVHVQYSFKIPASSVPILKKRPRLTNSARWEAAERNVAVEDHHLKHCARVLAAETFNHDDSAASTRSVSWRQPCSGVTRNGQPCRNRAATGQELCRVHNLGQTSYS